MYLFLRETETECEWVRDRERGRHRIWSRIQALSSQPRAQCGARTHELWDHDLSQSQMLNRLSHPDAPFFLMFIYFWRRETEHKQGRDRERGRHRIWSRLQALSCQQKTDTWLELMNCEIITWAEVGRLTESPRHPLFILSLCNVCVLH